MRRMPGILRRILKITGWIGCGLSALLFAATVVFWVRSLGHEELLVVDRFEPRPDWTAPDLAGQGTRRAGAVAAIRGRLWLELAIRSPVPEFKPKTDHRRQPISADTWQQEFDSRFLNGEHPWLFGTQRAWRFVGMGFSQRRSAVDSQIGRPNSEDVTLVLPFWMLAVLFALWPGVRLLRWLFRKQRYAAGLCPHCGYDLRATPERCPECGREVVASAR